VAYQDPKAAVSIQKKFVVLLSDYRIKIKKMDSRPVQIGVKFVAR
jgi:hypothetical protein